MPLSNVIVLYRAADTNAEELAAIQRHFRASTSRLRVQKGDLVIGRYSVLPYFKEQQDDIHELGARFLNSLREHNYVADLREWYHDLEGLTPKTWFRLEDVPKDGGPFVLKGATNSIKQHWATHMFARDFTEAGIVHGRLAMDGLIGQQAIYVRQYVPLRSYGTAIGGHPITEEYRFVAYKGNVLCGAYYWSGHLDVIGYEPTPSEKTVAFVGDVARRIARRIPCVVIDVAVTETGENIVVELNDFQMAGLSCIRPETLYASLADALTQERSNEP